MRRIQALATVLFFLLAGGAASGQEHQETVPADTVVINSVKEMFAKGAVEGHVRNFFMTTWNHRSLSDNYANAIGAGIRYKTAPYHGFRLGVAGLFTYNVFSSDMSLRDPIAGKLPRLELELFDAEHPENKADLDRLDELYLEYTSDHLRAKAGRFSFTSPLLNPQDGRMKPYSFQGIHLQVPLRQAGLFTLAWFNHFSPRSTVAWYRAEESIGIFPVGVDGQGNPSGYRHRTTSKGVAVAGLQVNSGSRFSAEGWNYWVDNIANTSYGQAVVEVAPQVKVGVESLYQFRVGDGGNAESSLAYFPDQKQWLAGGRVAYEPKNWHLSLNYLHLGAGGRFLFPREWGREQFFATLPRGRMEGAGKSDLLVAKVRRQWSGKLSSEAAVAKSWIPSSDDYQYNKYGAVGYWGWVADLNYKPAKPVLEGLSFRLLYVGRVSPGTNIPLKDMYYNTNYHNLNVVTQITF
jgi:hypothetical protein